MRESSGTGLGQGLILGIESSCDETAAAVVRSGATALSNVVASQMSLHANYGGVVPELASREHLRNIVPVVREAMSRAGITFSDLDAVAVTEGPGLAGALLVGITYAKALSFGLDKPLISVNHLEGHIHAVLMETRERSETPMELPLLALVVSGGHTHLYLARQQATSLENSEIAWAYRNVGRTVDDAAGEAYDKVAKLLGLGYPGGPWIDALAPHGNPRAVPFTFGEIKHRVHRDGTAPLNKKAPPRTKGPHFDFSFSGIKTAVLRYVETHHMRPGIEARRAALAADPTITPKSEPQQTSAISRPWILSRPSNTPSSATSSVRPSPLPNPSAPARSSSPEESPPTANSAAAFRPKPTAVACLSPSLRSPYRRITQP